MSSSSFGHRHHRPITSSSSSSSSSSPQRRQCSTPSSSSTGECTTFSEHYPQHNDESKRQQQQKFRKHQDSDPQQPIIDHVAWESYQELMSKIMEEPRVIRKSKTLDVESVRQFLLDPTTIYPLSDIIILGEENDDSQPQGATATAAAPVTADVRSQMEERSTAFLESMGFNKAQKEYMDRCFTYVGDRCAPVRATKPLQVAWLKWRYTGCLPRENSMSTYMYVLGLDDDENDGKNDSTRSPSLQKACLWDVVTMHDRLFPPNEKTITLRIQSYISQKNPLAAEQLLQTLVSSDSADNHVDGGSRLRTFTPILAYYCRQPNDDGDIAAALRLFRKMRESKRVHLDAATYALLLSSLASQGYFFNNNNNNNNNSDPNLLYIDDHHVPGPQLFDELATHMARDLLEVTETAAETIYEGFVKGIQRRRQQQQQQQDKKAPISNQTLLPHENEMTTTTSGIPSYAAIQEDGQVRLGRTFINTTTCICSGTGAKLRLLALDDEQRNHVHDTLLNMAFSLQEEYVASFKEKNKSMEPPTGEHCRQQILNFSNWLIERMDRGQHPPPPYTAFVDGANIAHFGSGFVQYSQVKAMVDELEQMGERPLVIMPHKYTTSKFFLRHVGSVQELGERDVRVIRDLVDTEKMFIVPPFCFDDYYWMIASVTDQKHESTISNDIIDANQAGVLPGLRPILITNDQMRDHRLALLEQRPFRRWTSCHIVNYSIQGYQKDPWETERKVTLFPPNTFSREIQSNEVPGGDIRRKAWHIPVTGWDDSNRLCIYLNIPTE